jgi:hypothetical protein
MKNVMFAVLLLLTFSAWASPPVAIRFESEGQFDPNLIYTATFTASGAIVNQGNLIDFPRYAGAAIHVNRTMNTSDGKTLIFRINANHVKGSRVVPTWCSPPATIPSGTFLVPETGDWELLSATGSYAALKGTGSWAAWVVIDPALGRPVAATDCMAGKVQVD